MSSQKRAGPFNEDVNAALESCFGDISGLQADFGDNSFNQSIGAVASTAGSAMSFGTSLGQDLSDPFAMEVIGHEVAHALAGGGSGQTGIDGAGDPGEARADDAGRRFADFVTGGGGPAPSLAPAWGGQAAIHRFESSEHEDAVDGAGDRILLNAYVNGTLSDSQRREIENRLQQEPALSDELTAIRRAPPGQLPPAHEVDPAVVDRMNQPVTLANGVELTPGQITALMGDFYGVFDADGNLDPLATFEQMNNASVEEMNALTSCLEREKNGEVIEAAEWEEITRMRRDDARDFNGDGIADNMTYLDLASRNDAHFSGRTMEGVDNNMGVYTILHQAALQAAEGGDIERAKALEASSMHYLTDRHASGHAFEKDGVMDASGYSNDTIANLFVKGVHDHYNENGMTLTNGDGESWQARGDGHWADGGNTANRSRTAESVYTSYSELEAVASGAQTAQGVEDAGYGTHRTVGQFDPVTQEEAEQRAADMPLYEAVWNVKDEAGLVVDKAKWWAQDTWQDGTEWLGDKWDGATDWVGDKWDGATDWAGEQWTGATDWAGEQWNGATDWAGDRLNDAGEWASDTWDSGTNWLGNQWDGATDWVSNTASDVGQSISSGWDTSTEWLGDRANDVGDAVSSGWDASTSWLGDRATDVGNAWDSSTEWIGNTASDVGSAVEDGWDSATDWVGGGVSDAGSAIASFFSW